MIWMSGWCTPGNVHHRPPGWAVFWTDAEGTPQMDAGWEVISAAELYAQCLRTYAFADSEMPIEIKEYRGEVPW